MKAQYTIDREQIENMDMTISLTMSVADWLKLMRAGNTEAHYHPINKVQNMISAALGDLTKATEKKYTVDHNLNKDVE